MRADARRLILKNPDPGRGIVLVLQTKRFRTNPLNDREAGTKSSHLLRAVDPGKLVPFAVCSSMLSTNFSNRHRVHRSNRNSAQPGLDVNIQTAISGAVYFTTMHVQRQVILCFTEYYYKTPKLASWSS